MDTTLHCPITFSFLLLWGTVHTLKPNAYPNSNLNPNPDPNPNPSANSWGRLR